MDAIESMAKFLVRLGCRKARGHDWYILDGFRAEFYLLFDCDDDPETPDSVGTCDIHIARIGASPEESDQRFRVVCNARRHQVMRFMFALGPQQFSDQTKTALYELNNVLRAQ